MARPADPESAMRLIRLIRRREILRIAIADSAGLLDQERVGGALAETHAWVVEPDQVRLEVGASSADIRAEKTVVVRAKR